MIFQLTLFVLVLYGYPERVFVLEGVLFFVQLCAQIGIVVLLVDVHHLSRLDYIVEQGLEVHLDFSNDVV